MRISLLSSARLLRADDVVPARRGRTASHPIPSYSHSSATAAARAWDEDVRVPHLVIETW
eukprot:4960994-Pleurochrysis_carterae.AAC.2